jgi:hypothetical protein
MIDSDCMELLVVEESSLGVCNCSVEGLSSDTDRDGLCLAGGLVTGLITDEGDSAELRDICVPLKCQLSTGLSVHQRSRNKSKSPCM